MSIELKEKPSEPVSSTNTNEIDLGEVIASVLNSIIGLFSKIKLFFKGCFSILFHLILVVKRNFIVLVLSIVIGAVLGFIMERKQGVLFSSTMTVKPHYSSGKELYNNISYLNNLIGAGQTQEIAEYFGISIESASFLKEFTIEPEINLQENLILYDDFLLSLDSLTRESSEISLETFLEDQPDYNYPKQQITAFATSNGVFAKLESGLLKSVLRNKYYQEIRSAQSNVYILETQSYLDAMSEVDSLESMYRQKMKLEAQKEASTGTNFYMAGTNDVSPEIKLVGKKVEYQKAISRIKMREVEEQNVIQVLSGFSTIGSKVSFVQRPIAKFALLSFALVFCLLMLFEVYKYIETLEKRDWVNK